MYERHFGESLTRSGNERVKDSKSQFLTVPSSHGSLLSSPWLLVNSFFVPFTLLLWDYPKEHEMACVFLCFIEGPLIDKDNILKVMQNACLVLHVYCEKLKENSFWKPYLGILESWVCKVLVNVCRTLGCIWAIADNYCQVISLYF